MASRWIMAAALLLCAQPALAQLGNDPDNPDNVLPDPKPVSRQAVPPSQTAEQAVVTPAAGSKQAKEEAAQPQKGCKPSDPCATETPEGR